MDRAEVIRRLGELRRSGVDIGIPLTSKTEVMVKRLEELSTKRSPQRSSSNKSIAHAAKQPTTTRERGSGKWPSEEVWYNILPRLNLRTLYRCMLLYHNCHRATKHNPIWSHLIRRDLGVVPSFVGNLRFYYLRQMNFGVPLNLYTWKPGESTVRLIDKDVILSKGKTSIYKGNRIGGVALPWSVTIRNIILDKRNTRSDQLLSTEGELFDDEGVPIKPTIDLPSRELLADFLDMRDYRFRMILTKSGQLYLSHDFRPEVLLRVPIKHPVIDLRAYEEGEVTTATGELYKIPIPYNLKVDTWKPTVEPLDDVSGSYLTRPLEVRRRYELEPLVLLTDGKLVSQDNDLSVQQQQEFGRYQFYSLAFLDTAYYMRGFERK